MKEIIKINNLSYSYDKKKTVLKNIKLSIYEGDFIALIGKNGCGKTTLSKHLNGILKPTDGSVFVNGKDTKETKLSTLASYIGYCYQNPDHQIFNGTIKEEIEFGPKNIGKSEEEITPKITEVMNIVGLNQPLDEYPFSLSKGERQKLAVASILAMETPVMVIDEPTTGLDWRGSQSMMELVKTLNDTGHTIIVITHDMRFVVKYAKRVIAMANGEVIADTTPIELLNDENTLNKANLKRPQINDLMREVDIDNSSDIAKVEDAVEFITKIYNLKGKVIER